MKKALKKSLSILLAITLIFGSASVGLGEVDFAGLFAVESKAASVSNLTFTLNPDGESYSVTDCATSASGELVIPSTYNGLPVTSIGDFAFEDCTSLTSVTIPDSVTSIGYYAFCNCTSLTSFAIPDSVTSIGDSTFSGCTSLKSITIPDSVTSIGRYAFYECTSLTSVYITDLANWCNIEFKDYYSNPLRYANKLYINGELATDIVIPDSVTSIGDYAFSWCTSLTSVTIGDSVTNIGYEAFSWCTRLTSVTIGKGVTSIGDYAFSVCESLTSVTIPDSVTSIGDGAFFYCTSLEYVFYSGTEDDRNNIFDDGILESATWHYEATGHTASGWITDKKATVYRAGSKHKECTVCGETLETATIPQLKCKAVKLNKIANVVSGVKIYWSKTTGADKYRVYRKVKGGSWQVMGYTTQTSYTDKTAKSGTTYYYCVRAMNEAGLGAACTTTKSIKRLATPKISSVRNVTSGIEIKWNKITGAETYRVYRKTSSSSWKLIATTSSTKYIDKATKKYSGKTYQYTVKAVYGLVVSSYYGATSANAPKIIRLMTPDVVSATSLKAGIRIKWDTVKGAGRYCVYRKTTGGWKRIATVKGQSKYLYTDKTAKKGTTYTYTVRAYSGDYSSSYESGVRCRDKY